MPWPVRTWSLHEAKTRLSALIKAARRCPPTITEQGKPAVVIVAADEYARLVGLDRSRAPDFAAHLLDMPADDGAFERLERRREALDWLAARRVGAKRVEDDAGAFVSRMRDEDER